MSNCATSGKPGRVRVMVVDDQASLRQMLVEVLATMPEFEVVAEAASLEEALKAVRCTHPELVVLDWIFPGGGGPAFLQALQADRTRCHVLILTGNTSLEIVWEACQTGARGVFEKGGNLREFIEALRAVAAGGAYFGPVASGFMQQLLSDGKAATGAAATG